MRGAFGLAGVVLCLAGSLAGFPSWSAEPAVDLQVLPADAVEVPETLPAEEPSGKPVQAPAEGPVEGPVAAPEGGLDGGMASLTAEEGAGESEPVASPKVNLPADLESDGAFRYRIGLNVPEFRGLVPDLGFRYSSSDHSRGDPGAVLGIGWSLAGLSFIDRVSERLGAPDWSATGDIFRLDGVELMACKDGGATNPWSFAGWAYPTAFHTAQASASCTAGGNMAPQRENYLRILRVGDEASTTSRFEVTRPDGTVMIYRSVGQLAGETGTVSDSHFGPAFRRLWLLSEIRDQQATANVVSLTYDFASRADGYAHRLRTVTYAGHEVRFHYEQLATPLATFSVGKTGQFGRQVHRLTSVTVKDGATQVRAYRLSYTASALTGASLLASVQEYGSNYVLTGAAITGGTALPATTFGYSADAYALTDQLYGSQYKFNPSSAVWDFNEDQRQDLVFSQENYGAYEIGEQSIPALTLPKGHFGFDAARAIQTLPDGWIPVPSFYSTNPAT